MTVVHRVVQHMKVEAQFVRTNPRLFIRTVVGVSLLVVLVALFGLGLWALVMIWLRCGGPIIC